MLFGEVIDASRELPNKAFEDGPHATVDARCGLKIFRLLFQSVVKWPALTHCTIQEKRLRFENTLSPAEAQDNYNFMPVKASTKVDFVFFFCRTVLNGFKSFLNHLQILYH